MLRPPPLQRDAVFVNDAAPTPSDSRRHDGAPNKLADLPASPPPCENLLGGCWCENLLGRLLEAGAAVEAGEVGVARAATLVGVKHA
jgi:hypothetical protein